ncbi:stimulated by retinoic acid gene 6 protein-like isoform X4 [Argopecten irradians]|uniref:stimulated by retinoic acid gene 6 protein-like isoform X4 n=2 Tax=Argopecten irradians TaxID=31199 RepID=UPI0037210000
MTIYRTKASIFDWSALVLFLLTILLSIVIGLTYYPLFVCLTPSLRFVHSTIGLGYSTLWLGLTSLRIQIYVKCYKQSEWMLTGTLIAMYIPQVVCLLYLALRFLYMLATDIKHTFHAYRNGHTGCIELAVLDKAKNDRLANAKQIQHVRMLFLKPDNSTSPGQFINKLLDTIQLSYKKERPFRYSRRVVVTFTVALLCLYQVTVSVFGVGTYEIISLAEFVDNLEFKNSSVLFEFKDEFYDVLTVSFYVSLILATLLSGISIFQIMVSYRRNMMALYRGDFSVIPNEAYHQSAITVMIDNLHYPGYQIAYLFWGYLIHIDVFFIACVLIAYLVVLPILGKVPLGFLQPFLTLVSTTAIRLLINIVQKFISKRWLLHDHDVLNTETGKNDKVLSLKNRDTYHNMAYFMFFYYILIALIRCLMRIVKAVVLGVILFGRIDRSGLMHGFETWDTGYMAYVSFLQMELVHCHPVLVVFCDQLLKRSSAGTVQVPMHNTNNLPNHTRSRTTSKEELLTSSSVGHYGTSCNVTASIDIPKYNRRIHNRWLKVYTLLRNPSLVHC